MPQHQSLVLCLLNPSRSTSLHHTPPEGRIYILSTMTCINSKLYWSEKGLFDWITKDTLVLCGI